MWMMRRIGIWLGMGALIALGTTPARAAHLVEVDRRENHTQSPETATLDPCFASALASFSAGTDGRTASIDQNLHATARGTVGSCSGSAIVDVSITVSFLIAPDQGETTGDPVTLCAQARGTVSDRSEGGYTARTQLGAVSNIADPAFVSVNAVNVVTLGPFDQTAGVDQGQSKQTVAAAVGDTVEMELHGIVNAGGSGV